MATAGPAVDLSRLGMPEGERRVKALDLPATRRPTRADAERAAIAALRERWHASDESSSRDSEGVSATSGTSPKPRGGSGAVVALAAAAIAAMGAALFLPGRLPTDLAGRLGDLGKLTGLAADSGPAPISTAAAETPGRDEPERAPAEGGLATGDRDAAERLAPAAPKARAAAPREGEIRIPQVVAVEQPGPTAGETSPGGPFFARPGEPGVGGSEPAEPDYSLAAIRGRPQFVYVDSPAVLESRLHPRYSHRLAEQNVGGTVTLWVLVSDAGTVEDVRLLRSSGDSELDGAALEALRSARYRPARRGATPVPTWARQQVVFRSR
jgi:protein TonB